MSAAELVFGALALLALAAGGVAAVGGPARGLSALVVVALAGAGVCLLLAAPGAGLVLLAALSGAALVARVALHGEGEASEPETPRRRGIVALAAATLVGLGLVLVGTWARQFVWTGKPLTAAADLGGLGALGGALAGSFAPALLGIGLLLVVVAAACSRP